MALWKKSGSSDVATTSKPPAKTTTGVPIGFPIDTETGGVIDDVFIVYRGETHQLTCAGAGSGKFTCSVGPELIALAGAESLICIDPKGQASAVCHAEVRRRSRVITLNPYGLFEDLVGAPSGCNPLASLDPRARTFTADVTTIAEALIVIDSERERHFADSARALLVGLIIFVVKYGEPEMQNLPFVRSVIGGTLAAFGGFINAAMTCGDRLVTERLSRFADISAEDREVQSILGTARTQTEWLSDDAMAESLSRDDFRFAELRERPTTVFLILPGELLDARAKWLRLITATAIKDLMQKIDGYRVAIILDEFPALGHLKQIETMMGLGRGYKVRLHVICQNLQQLSQVYPNSWTTFEANAGMRQYFGVRDWFTAEHVAKMSGETTRRVASLSVREISRQEARDGFSGVSTSYSLIGRPLLMPQDVLRLSDREQLLFLDKVPYVVRATRQPYWEFSGVQDGRIQVLPDPYHDPEGARRAAIRGLPAPTLSRSQYDRKQR